MLVKNKLNIIMKKYNIPNLEGICNVCGINDGSPLKINKVIKKRGSFNEKFHYHKESYEYYILFMGEIVIGLKERSLNVRENEIVRIDPGEQHRIEKILQNAFYLVIKAPSAYPEDKIVLEEGINIIEKNL